MKSKKKAQQEEKKSKRSEEVADIIDRMPVTFGRWISITIVTLTALLFLFGWIIKYPDVVSGKIKINSNVSPVKLVANASGKVSISNINAQDLVMEGDYLAVIQNPAQTNDVRTMRVLLDSLALNKNDILQHKILFPEKVSLGELNTKYYSFLSALKSYCDFKETNVYDQQKSNLHDDIKWKETILDKSLKVLETTKENMEISEKWHSKYADLNKELIATYEYEVDRSKSDYLSAKLNKQNLEKEIASINMQITESKNRLLTIGIDKKEKERQLMLDLLHSFHDLDDNIKLWEQKYVLKAPFTGKVEFLKFWTSDQFIQAGEEVFGIIPQNSNIVGQVLLPSYGVGKVKTGDHVSIKLNNYPYTEFGSIKGVVNSISLIPQEYKEQQQSLDVYLVSVDMPEGLITNYGENLKFEYELGGIADIIVNDRRLIERLFDNLKSNTR